jgi:hypothetical protein
VAKTWQSTFDTWQRVCRVGAHWQKPDGENPAGKLAFPCVLDGERLPYVSCVRKKVDNLYAQEMRCKWLNMLIQRITEVYSDGK